MNISEKIKSTIKTVKDKIGIEGVSAQLQIPNYSYKKDNLICGKVHLTTQSIQYINNIFICLEERQIYQIKDEKSINGTRDETKSYTYGEIKLSEKFRISPGEIIEVDFELPFEINSWQFFHFGCLANNRRTAVRHFVVVKVDVKNTWFNPWDERAVVLM